ncbi:uncharacterized protein BXIN_0821 [Babesia sp. Xinjiang]|uniref:uncharacterized protein n=1 Tax=Babesia sp. Xinjiang TaxID=462227 RepID=UPI000A23E23D|nr:uncharacterized protein BXIN_0821 [Babesia sp. Xinjiang]ORM41282.1 hypothetical protein BXIN_0821 [Babesia sp. Xinjiang]
MPDFVTGERRAGLFGLRRRLEESCSARTDSVSSTSQQGFRKSRSLLDNKVHRHDVNPEAAIVGDRLLQTASESRNELLQSFYEVVRPKVPGIDFVVSGTIPGAYADHIFECCTEQLIARFGPNNVIRFHAHQLYYTQFALLFRGETEGIEYDVLVNRVK